MGHDGAVAIGAFTGAAQTGPTSMTEARRFTNWTFTCKGTFSAGGVTVQGSIDDGVTWFDLVPDAVNTSTGMNVNPITSTDAEIRYKGPLTAVRGVSDGSFSGTVTLLGFATP